VAGDPVQGTFFGPASVPVHDNRAMAGKFFFNQSVHKEKNIRNLFATEVAETTEGFTFKNQKEKANACGTCFDGAG
jgi:hypothetical protein